MDPLTVIILMLVVLAGGVGGVSSHRTKQRNVRLKMRDAIRSRQAIDGQLDVSIFDVFWDLGCSDFALEIMGSQGLLLDDVDDLRGALEALQDRIREEGSYSEFVRESLETIQEFYREHRAAGNRRALPTMTAKPRKTLPLPAITAETAAEALEANTLPVPYTGRYAPVQRLDDPGLRSLAPMRGSSALVLHQGGALEFDLDEVTRIDAFSMLKGIFTGKSNELERWWELRTLRGMREELNESLRRLYFYYAEQARNDGQFYKHLYDTAIRWDAEARRIDTLLEARPYKDRTWRNCADALLLESRAVARQLAYRSRANVEQTVELIHSHARRGDMPMAGYLVFLNHHAFFAGRGDRYAEFVRRIETKTYQIQQEVRALGQKSVI